MSNDDKLKDQLEGTVSALADEVHAMGSGWPENEHSRWLDHYGLEAAELAAEYGEVKQGLTEFHIEGVLSIEQSRTYHFVHGTGGPHVEVAITVSNEVVENAEAIGLWGSIRVVQKIDPETAEAYLHIFGIDGKEER